MWFWLLLSEGCMAECLRGLFPPPSSPKASKAWLSRSKAAARLAKGPRPEGSDPERSPERCVEGGFGASSSPLFYIKNLRLLSGLLSGLPPLFALP